MFNVWYFNRIDLLDIKGYIVAMVKYCSESGLKEFFIRIECHKQSYDVW